MVQHNKRVLSLLNSFPEKLHTLFGKSFTLEFAFSRQLFPFNKAGEFH